MKIRSKLTLQYTAVTAVIFLMVMLSIYIYSEQRRSESFFRSLKHEAVTKAHLYLSGKVTAGSMQLMYLNNKEFINEVEVAIYLPPFDMIYHDAIQSDIVQETEEMFQQVLQQRTVEFYIGDYQAVGLVYPFQEREYILTAVAYDGYGYANLRALKNLLILLTFVGMSLLWVVGYLLAKSALAPVKDIVERVRGISATNIDQRLPEAQNHDELKELIDSFNELLEKVSKAFNAQKLFVSNVSHELRTPMAAMIAETELTLLKPRERARYEESLHNILSDSTRLIKLVDGLLNLAKADYNPSQIKMEEVRLDELLMEARKLVIKAHADYHVDLMFDAEADSDSMLTIVGNIYLLTTAFVNLMENNCKFSDNHTSIVQIGFWDQETLIKFSDNGIGIAPENLPQLFTPFYRGENRSYTSGYGIGLALVQKIIFLHGGHIEVHSVLREGTTFVIRLSHI